MRPELKATGVWTRCGDGGDRSVKSCLSLAAAGETAEVGPGTYVHPFTCQLPQGCVRVASIFVSVR